MSDADKVKFALKTTQIRNCVHSLDEWRIARLKKNLPVASLEETIELLDEYGKWVSNIANK